jgi:hypothetical protein
MYKKVESEFNHEMQPTEFMKVNIEASKKILRGKEIKMADDINLEVETLNVVLQLKSYHLKTILMRKSDIIIHASQILEKENKQYWTV